MNTRNIKKAKIGKADDLFEIRDTDGQPHSLVCWVKGSISFKIALGGWTRYDTTTGTTITCDGTLADMKRKAIDAANCY